MVKKEGQESGKESEGQRRRKVKRGRGKGKGRAGEEEVKKRKGKEWTGQKEEGGEVEEEGERKGGIKGFINKERTGYRMCETAETGSGRNGDRKREKGEKEMEGWGLESLKKGDEEWEEQR